MKATGKWAFSSEINTNLKRFLARRRPPIFLGAHAPFVARGSPSACATSRHAHSRSKRPLDLCLVRSWLALPRDSPPKGELQGRVPPVPPTFPGQEPDLRPLP